MSQDANLSLEAALEDLDTIVGQLEEGRLTLEESLKLYERGMGLIRICNAKLDCAERKIECLTGSLPEDLTE